MIRAARSTGTGQGSGYYFSIHSGNDIYSVIRNTDTLTIHSHRTILNIDKLSDLMHGY